MPRKSPKDSAIIRDSMRTTIEQDHEEILRRVRREALQGIRRLNADQFAPSYSPEMAPGLFFEDVGVQFARAKKKRKRSTGGLA